ncbi:hypothetical protein ACUII0_002442 [Providencia rettgeri]|uniref:hypothetical protein n=1 Tax=Providencia rettgeri TaxID=587 RepID=UPI002882AB76|nr:hypothetical protein [Providencia rettgeri]EMA4647216.1 hypothetical protein [Providencia rettgeri]MDK3108272.1 hypothetical protein [Providencia rettgeri]WRR95917.1 hypothetical protein VNI59_14260 [Providencia rettgeri]
MDIIKNNILRKTLILIGVPLFAVSLAIIAVIAMYVGEYGFSFSAENLAKILN